MCSSLLSVTRLSAKNVLLIRGFASPSHDGFAVIEKGPGKLHVVNDGHGYLSMSWRLFVACFFIGWNSRDFRERRSVSFFDTPLRPIWKCVEEDRQNNLNEEHTRGKNQKYPFLSVSPRRALIFYQSPVYQLIFVLRLSLKNYTLFPVYFCMKLYLPGIPMNPSNLRKK